MSRRDEPRITLGQVAAMIVIVLICVPIPPPVWWLGVITVAGIFIYKKLHHDEEL